MTEGVEQYRPWRDAGARPELEVMVVPLPAGVRALHAVSAGYRAILVNRNLPAAERLLPLDALAAWVDREEAVGRPVTVDTIADAHDIADQQARALHLDRATGRRPGPAMGRQVT